MKRINLYIIIIFSLLPVANIFAQNDKSNKYNIKISKPGYKANLETKLLYKKLVKAIKKDFKSGYYTPFVIIPDAAIEDTHLIEGMETQTLVDLKINLTVKNTSTDEEWIWEHIFKGKGDNKNKSIKKAVRKFIKKDSGYKDFSTRLQNYIQNELDKNCQNYIALAKEKYQEKKYYECIQICNFFPKDNNCFEDAALLKKSAFDAIQKQKCESLLYKAKMKKSIKDYDAAINYLIRISPDSPCSEKAVSLAKEMESSIDNNIKSIDLYKIIINSSSDASSKEKWLEKAMDNISK